MHAGSCRPRQAPARVGSLVGGSAFTAPESYPPGEIVAAISGQPGVASVHDLHAWLGSPAVARPWRLTYGRAPGRLPSAADRVALAFGHESGGLVQRQPHGHGCTSRWASRCGDTAAMRFGDRAHDGQAEAEVVRAITSRA
jgi:hypothetical protein